MKIGWEGEWCRVVFIMFCTCRYMYNNATETFGENESYGRHYRKNYVYTSGKIILLCNKISGTFDGWWINLFVLRKMLRSGRRRQRFSGSLDTKKVFCFGRQGILKRCNQGAGSIAWKLFWERKSSNDVLMLGHYITHMLSEEKSMLETSID